MSAFIHLFVSAGLECPGQPSAQKRSERNQPVKITNLHEQIHLKDEEICPCLYSVLYCIVTFSQFDGFVAAGDVSCRSTCLALPYVSPFSTFLTAQNKFIFVNLLLFYSTVFNIL